MRRVAAVIVPLDSLSPDRFDTGPILKRLAAALDVTVGEAVRVAVRRMHQEQIGVDLMTPPTDIDVDWLDADLG